MNITGKVALVQINILDDINVFCDKKYDDSAIKNDNGNYNLIVNNLDLAGELIITINKDRIEDIRATLTRYEEENTAPKKKGTEAISIEDVVDEWKKLK